MGNLLRRCACVLLCFWQPHEWSNSENYSRHPQRSLVAVDRGLPKDAVKLSKTFFTAMGILAPSACIYIHMAAFFFRGHDTATNRCTVSCLFHSQFHTSVSSPVSYPSFITQVHASVSGPSLFTKPVKPGKVGGRRRPGAPLVAGRVGAGSLSTGEIQKNVPAGR